uniref:Phosphoinositide phosphatase family protein n=1 Tax=Tetraselmis sp. GSL018 TaxID=582737 RepID=A0A061RQS1_9CHLO
MASDQLDTSIAYGIFEDTIFLSVSARPPPASAGSTVFVRFCLSNGVISRCAEPPLKLSEKAHGIAGASKVGGSWALVLITNTEQVGVIRGSEIRRVLATHVLALPASGSGEPGDTDLGRLELLRAGLSPKVYGEGLYYARGSDLTASLQRQSEGPRRREGARQFLWNAHLVAPFDGAGLGGAVERLIMGSVRVARGLEWPRGGETIRGSVAVVSRRSTRRAGCRHWRRGASAEGHAANFVETEQIVCLEDGGSEPEAVASFVQVRGSIPILWMQPPDLRFKPRTHIGPDAASCAALARHFEDLHEQYGKVTVLSLVSASGAEGRLQEAFVRALGELGASSHLDAPTQLRFDVHSECGALANSGFAEKLLRKVEPHLDSTGIFFQSGGEVRQRQGGVVRTNCFDSLDRTNMAQAVLAGRVLGRALGLLGVPGQSALPEPLRRLWAEHGDELARQYAGTGAMKSHFTRTGRVSLLGLADDLRKATLRYFRNCFEDGRKQDAIDAVLGNEDEDGGPNPARAPPPLPVLPGWQAMLLIAISAAGTSLLASRGSWPAVALAVATVAALAARAPAAICRPTLCPAAHKQW